MQAEAGAPLTGRAAAHDDPDMAPDDAPGEVADAPAPPPPRSRPRLFWTVLVVAAAWICLDQLTKAWAERELPGRGGVPLVGELLQLRLTYNSGAAFSMATGATWVLSLLAGGVVLFIVWQASRLGSRGWAWALALLLGGAAGNLSDRLFRPPSPGQGHVVDFLQLPNFPIFNVADIGITSAAVLIGILALRGISPDGSRAGANDAGHSDEHEDAGSADA